MTRARSSSSRFSKCASCFLFMPFPLALLLPLLLGLGLEDFVGIIGFRPFVRRGVAPRGHGATFDVQFPRQVGFLQHAAEHRLARQRLAFDETLERRDRGDDLVRTGDAQLNARREVVARILAQSLDAVHHLARQPFLSQIHRQPGIDGRHVRPVGLHRPVAHHLARHGHVLGSKLELANLRERAAFQRLAAAPGSAARRPRLRGASPCRTASRECETTPCP